MSPLLRSSSRACTAFLLTILMVDQPFLLAATPDAPSPSAASSTTSGSIQGNDRILHALNRLTYGPRPGDVEAVQKEGLNRWFEQQLNPQGIDNSDLDSKLQEYPAMQLSAQQLMERYPNNQMVRSVANGLMGAPKNPVERAIYTDQAYFYRLAKGENPNQPSKYAPAAKMQDDSMNADSMAPAATGKSGKKGGEKAEMNSIIARDGDEFTDEQVQQILQQQPDQRFQTIIAMSPPRLVAFHQALGKKNFQFLQGMTPVQREQVLALTSSRPIIAGELFSSMLLREIYSSRQLQEVMTDFWLNHFNVYLKKNELTPYYLVPYVRDTIAPRALGHFEDLLVATATSPAMMSYLDNMESVGPDSPSAKGGDHASPYFAARVAAMVNNPDAQQQLKQAKEAKKSQGLNENYARELMELHTLGVNGGYTQHDVTEVAKVFTGWTVEKAYRGGGFVFDPSKHEPGPKYVLGRTIQENGSKEGLEVLHMLATSPKTAQFISRELAVRFVADVPPQSLVDKMAATFLSTNGDIKAVLRTMFYSPEFWSKDVYRAKVKTPLEFVVSAVRASDVQMRSPLTLSVSMERMGMPMFGCQPPTGYYWRASDWVSTSALVTRMNFALALSANALPGIITDWSSMLNEGGVASLDTSADRALTTPEKEQRLESMLLGRPVSEKTRQTVLTQADTLSLEEAGSKFSVDLSDVSGFNDTAKTSKKDGDGGISKMLSNMRPQPPPADKQASIMAGLLIGSPEFQRR